MSTTTFDFVHSTDAAAPKRETSSFLSRLQAARARQAEREVARYLARFTDEELAKLGHSPANIAALRKAA